MYVAVESVEPLDGYKLRIGFRNGEHRVFDMQPYLDIGRFSELRDASMFSSVSVKFDSIEWANHLDLDPEFLYDKSVGLKTA